MLVLQRKVGESFVIAGTIAITVLRIEGGRVKLGITAPPDVAIVREELLEVPDHRRSIPLYQRRGN